MAIVTLEITTEWFADKPNFNPCDACGEMMVTNSNGLYLFHGANLFDETPAIVLCNSCCQATKQEL